MLYRLSSLIICDVLFVKNDTEICERADLIYSYTDGEWAHNLGLVTQGVSSNPMVMVLVTTLNKTRVKTNFRIY